MSVTEIGCCGAYCGKCPEFVNNICRGCKLGYDNGERDINRAKCKMKLCCFRDNGLQTCADCSDFESCELIQGWYEKGYKYKRYKQSTEFIRKYGYEKFLKKAKKWKSSVGKFD
jgi:hypothetical protein